MDSPLEALVDAESGVRGSSLRGILFRPKEELEMEQTLRAMPRIGDKAPDFTLPSTTGKKISLNQFRGKKLVLLEFYGADFSPV